MKITRKSELLQKEADIKKELQRLKKIYKKLDKDKLSVADGLIQEAAFMRVTLTDLKNQINKEGPTELFEQGIQSMIREHPASKVYNTMIKNYTSICKHLLDLLPPGDDNKSKEDELLQFLKGDIK